MLLELAGGFALIIFSIMAFAEYFRKPGLAIIASVLLFPLGGWILGDGLQMKTGELLSNEGNITETSTSFADINLTITNSTYKEETQSTNQYEDLPTTPYISFTELVGLLCFLLGIYTTSHYAVRAWGARGSG